jgi:hypothetical protein
MTILFFFRRLAIDIGRPEAAFLLEDDFVPVRIAKAGFEEGQPVVVASSSRGGAVVMNLDGGDARLVAIPLIETGKVAPNRSLPAETLTRGRSLPWVIQRRGRLKTTTVWVIGWVAHLRSSTIRSRWLAKASISNASPESLIVT